MPVIPVAALGAKFMVEARRIVFEPGPNSVKFDVGLGDP